MKKLTKYLMIVSLICLAVSCGLLVGAVFGLPVFEDKMLLKVLLIFSTFAIAGGLAIGEINVYQKNKILGIISLSLLSVSVLLAIISLFVEWGVFTKITIVVSLVSVLFCFIVSFYTKLGKSLLALQICTYVALTLLDIFLILLTCDVAIFETKGMLEVFIILIIASIGLCIATKVVSSRKKDTPIIENKRELETLKLQVESLTKENETLRQQIDILKQENEKLKK